MTHKIKYFGLIDFQRLKKWYKTEVALNGSTIELSITISEVAKNFDKEDFQNIERYIDNLEENEKNIRLFIQNDFIEEGTSKDYIKTQVETQDQEDRIDLAETADISLNDQERLLTVLSLLRIVFYPEKDDKMFAVFDYTIDEHLTDELLVIKVRKDNTLTIESES